MTGRTADEQTWGVFRSSWWTLSWGATRLGLWAALPEKQEGPKKLSGGPGGPRERLGKGPADSVTWPRWEGARMSLCGPSQAWVTGWLSLHLFFTEWSMLVYSELAPAPLKGGTARGVPWPQNPPRNGRSNVRAGQRKPLPTLRMHSCGPVRMRWGSAPVISLGAFLARRHPTHRSISNRKWVAVPRPPGDRRTVSGACQEIPWPQAQGDFQFPSLLLILG